MTLPPRDTSRMGDDVVEVIGVAFDCEIEPPSPIHPGLPDTTGLVELLGPKRGVAKVLEQQGQASIKRPLDKWGSAFVTPTEALAEANPHLGSFSLLARLQHSDCLLG